MYKQIVGSNGNGQVLAGTRVLSAAWTLVGCNMYNLTAAAMARFQQGPRGLSAAWGLSGRVLAVWQALTELILRSRSGQVVAGI